MAIRFRKTKAIVPGVRLNLTKTGISARVGPKGLGVTTGTSGTTVSAGIPGTGLHASQKIKKTSKVSNASTLVEEDKRGLGFFGWFGVITICLGILWFFL